MLGLGKIGADESGPLHGLFRRQRPHSCDPFLLAREMW